MNMLCFERVARIVVYALVLAGIGVRANGQCGPEWVATGDGVTDTDGAVLCALHLADGRTVVGGAFTRIHGVAANHIAVSSGTTWAPLGGGANGQVLSLAQLPNGDIVAGGTFRGTADGDASGVARWDGARWNDIGGGVTGGVTVRVNALAVLPNGDLAVGGNLTQAGGMGMRALARWNGSQWSAFPALSNPPSLINAFALAANGDLLAASDSSANSVLRYSASGVTAVGGAGAGAIPGPCRGLVATTAGDLYAVGVRSGGNAYYIARWTGSMWTYATTPVPLNALALFQGEVVAGGSLQYILTPHEHLFRYTGAAIEPYAEGISRVPDNGGAVNMLYTLPNGDLLVGGDFHLVNGQPSAYLATLTAGPGADFNHDGDVGTDQDIEAFFACLAGRCCPACPGNPDFDGDGDVGTDADIESFFRVLAGGSC